MRRENEKSGDKLTIKFKMPTELEDTTHNRATKSDCLRGELWNFIIKTNIDTKRRIENKKRVMETCDKCQVSLNGPPASKTIKRVQIDLFYADISPFIAFTI